QAQAETAGGLGEVRPGHAEMVDGDGDRRARRREELDLRGRELELVARVGAERAQELGRPRRELERLRVEQHELLLDPHGERGGAVETLAEGCGVHDVRAAAAAGNKRRMRVITVPGVFQPRSDTWMLVETVRRLPLAPGA